MPKSSARNLTKNARPKDWAVPLPAGNVAGLSQKVKRHIFQVVGRGDPVRIPRHVKIVPRQVAGRQLGDGLLLPPRQLPLFLMQKRNYKIRQRK